MRSNKAIINILSSLGQLVLQHRLDITNSFLKHIDALKRQINHEFSHNSFSSTLLYFLVEREFYSLKHKIYAKSNPKTLQHTSLTITVSAFNRSLNLTNCSELWILEAYPSDAPNNQKYFYQSLLQLIQTLISRLASQRFFDRIIRHLEHKKKCIIDFKIEVNPTHSPSALQYCSYWQKDAQLNSNLCLRVRCYESQINEKQCLFEGGLNQIHYFSMSKPDKYGSQQTQSGSNDLSYGGEILQNYCLNQASSGILEQKIQQDSYEQLLESYDDNSCLFELLGEESCKFQFLIQDQDECFLMENEKLFLLLDKFMN